MAVGGWLAVMAAAVMAAGVPTVAGAAARTKVAVKAKGKVKRTVVARRRTPARAVVAVAPSVPAPYVTAAPMAARYRWLDDADGLMQAVGDTAPDLSFTDEGQTRYAWRLADGALVVAEPMGPGDTRFYFFDSDMTAPFLVRDRLYAFGFDRGRLSEVYDVGGQVVPWTAGDWRDGMAEHLYARGRHLWFAARAPGPVRRTAGPAPWVSMVADLGRWRDDDRRRTGGERRRDRGDHARPDRREVARSGEPTAGIGGQRGRDGRERAAGAPPRPSRRGERVGSTDIVAAPASPTSRGKPSDREDRRRIDGRVTPVDVVPPSTEPVAFAPILRSEVDQPEIARGTRGQGDGERARALDGVARHAPARWERGDREGPGDEAPVPVVAAEPPPLPPPTAAPEPVAPSPPAPPTSPLAEPEPARVDAPPPPPAPTPPVDGREPGRERAEPVLQE